MRVPVRELHIRILENKLIIKVIFPQTVSQKSFPRTTKNNAIMRYVRATYRYDTVPHMLIVEDELSKCFFRVFLNWNNSGKKN